MINQFVAVFCRVIDKLEYKYVVVESNGYVSRWKSGGNYVLDTQEINGSSVTVTETWDEIDGARQIEVQGSASKNGNGSHAASNGKHDVSENDTVASVEELLSTVSNGASSQGVIKQQV